MGSFGNFRFLSQKRCYHLFLFRYYRSPLTLFGSYSSALSIVQVQTLLIFTGNTDLHNFIPYQDAFPSFFAHGKDVHLLNIFFGFVKCFCEKQAGLFRCWKGKPEEWFIYKNRAANRMTCGPVEKKIWHLSH